jgi:hypothetical protein
MQIIQTAKNKTWMAGSSPAMTKWAEAEVSR